MEWQDISTAPKDGTKIDLWFKWEASSPGRKSNCWWEEGEWRDEFCHGFHESGTPTHWIPLPEPPQEQGNRMEENIAAGAVCLLLIMIPSCMIVDSIQETERLKNPNYIKLKELESAQDAKKYIRLKDCFNRLERDD